MKRVLPALAVALVLPGTGARPSSGVPADTVSQRDRVFVLQANTGFPTAHGAVTLRRAWSPFDITLTPDGRVVYDAVVTVQGLPPLPPGAAYVAWLASPALDRVQLLGPVDTTAPLTRRVDWNQFLVIVTREPGRPGERWVGPPVLTGRSRSALIRPLWGHSFFRRTPF